MNKKAQSGYIGIIFMFIIFIVNWFIWLGAWLNTVGEYVINNNGLTGIEAFAFSNLNFIVLICMILGILAFAYLGGGEA